jgi:hypothetical protein
MNTATASLDQHPLIRCPSCLRCDQVAYTWQAFANGTRHVRADCRRCGRYIKFAPRRSPYTDLADASASTSPILDALTLAESLGVELASDGVAVWPVGDTPPDLIALVRQCSPDLAQMLGDTRRRDG